MNVALIIWDKYKWGLFSFVMLAIAIATGYLEPAIACFGFYWLLKLGV